MRRILDFHRMLLQWTSKTVINMTYCPNCGQNMVCPCKSCGNNKECKDVWVWGKDGNTIICRKCGFTEHSDWWVTLDMDLLKWDLSKRRKHRGEKNGRH